MEVHTHPFDILLVPPVEVYDPVAEGLERGRGQAPPDGGDLAVVEGLGHLV